MLSSIEGEEGSNPQQYSFMLGSTGQLIWHQLFPNITQLTTIQNIEFSDNPMAFNDSFTAQGELEAQTFSDSILPLFKVDPETNVGIYKKHGEEMFIVVHQLNMNLEPELNKENPPRENKYFYA